MTPASCPDVPQTQPYLSLLLQHGPQTLRLPHKRLHGRLYSFPVRCGIQRVPRLAGGPVHASKKPVKIASLSR